MYKPSSKIIVDSKTQSLILEILSCAPSQKWLTDKLSHAQKVHWYEVKINCDNLHYIFEKYFQGQDPSTPSLNKKQLQLLELERDTYLYLYDMLRQCWKFVKPEIWKLGKGFDFTVPGEAATQAIGFGVEASFSACLQYSTFHPSALYEMYRTTRKLQKLVSSRLELKQPLTQGEVNRFKQHASRVNAAIPLDNNAIIFIFFLLEACAMAAHYEIELRPCVKESLRRISLRNEAFLKCLPGKKGFEFDGKGNKLHASSKGGIYE
ncbi:MAG TPA: hypothetical protein V6C84_26290 [Coleofasciculaceae cyanobacterium]|jgi:hypothetical protein